jgi:HAD superfamily hydrolase (TIGR01509 family)
MDALELNPEYSAKICFACGRDNPIGLKLRPFHDGEKVTAEFTAGEFHQGWTEAIHGGILYTLLDEVNAYAMLCHGVEFGVTAKSEIRFRQAAPINEPIKASAWVTKAKKRLVETQGVLTLKDNTVIADGDFMFYVWRLSKRTVLWDMDGVIADTRPFHLAAWQEAFASRGVQFTEEDFGQLFGTRNDFIVGTVMGQQLSEQDVQAMVEEKEKLFRRKATGNIQPFPGAVGLLNAIKKANLRLGLVSSAPAENIDLVIGELGLNGVFDCIVFGREASQSKPSPQIYLLAADRLQVAPADCLVIEDSHQGIRAAKAAGMKCLAVTNTHARHKLQEADRIVDSLEEVDLITLMIRT